MDSTKKKTLDIIYANVENIQILPEQFDDDLSQMGMDSIKFITIVVQLEEKFSFELPDEYLLMTEMNTINKIISIVELLLEEKE